MLFFLGFFVFCLFLDKDSLIKPWLAWNSLSINLEHTEIFLRLPAKAEIKVVHCHYPKLFWLEWWWGVDCCFVLRLGFRSPGLPGYH